MGLEAAVEEAARDLPEGWTIEIRIEKDAGWVELWGPGGPESVDGSYNLEEQVRAALDIARKGLFRK